MLQIERLPNLKSRKECTELVDKNMVGYRKTGFYLERFLHVNSIAMHNNYIINLAYATKKGHPTYRRRSSHNAGIYTKHTLMDILNAQ